MPQTMQPSLSLGKRALFWSILVAIPVFCAALMVLGYYLYAYLTLPAGYCGSFARLDGQAGWVLKPATESCVIGYTPDGAEAFRASVHTDENGGRVPIKGAEAPKGGLLALGDSWTFGYGIEGTDTFAARLEAEHGLPTALFASPAYSGAQALLLGQRAVDFVRPRGLIYLELGFWERAVCSGSSEPRFILKPCYWADGSGAARLTLPPEGLVETAARFGLRPGGMVGAGEKTLTYFMISRPASQAMMLLTRAGMLSGFADDFRAVGSTETLAAIKRAHFENMIRLSQDAGIPLILIDPAEAYANAKAQTTSDLSKLVYLDRAVWNEEVAIPMAALPALEANVPHDGHYGPGTHRLIAAMIARHWKESR